MAPSLVLAQFAYDGGWTPNGAPQFDAARLSAEGPAPLSAERPVLLSARAVGIAAPRAPEEELPPPSSPAPHPEPAPDFDRMPTPADEHVGRWIDGLPALRRLPLPIDAESPELPSTLAVVHTPLNYPISPTVVNLHYDWFRGCYPVEHWYDLDVQVRSYYGNDQRIEFTGQEATFGVESALAARLVHQAGEYEFGVLGELFVNQPFDRNILVDTPERESYRGNFEIEALEISQALVTGRRGDVMVGLGKMVTPFGRTYFPLYRNDLSDAPFLRTESILWRETGFLVQYDPGPWVFTAALVNGGKDRDTNSSKGIVARVGLDLAEFACGASVKWHDGIGSEGQKTFNNHVGVDLMFRRGAWTISAEAIYDEYGFRRPGFDPGDITWGRSLYFRDQNLADGEPITGIGYYASAVYEAAGWTGVLNYGEFYPEQIGDPLHDVTTRRGFAKFILHFSSRLDVYTMFMLENHVPDAQGNRDRKGSNVLAGFQFTL